MENWNNGITGEQGFLLFFDLSIIPSFQFVFSALSAIPAVHFDPRAEKIG
jgi:hypothetical protein